VVALDGFPRLSEDQLKWIGAAAASSGAVAMFHVVGSTPEATTLEAALGGTEAQETYEIGLDELRSARDGLSSAHGSQPGDPIGAVSMGTPHASLAELSAVADELAGQHIAPGVELLISTGRAIQDMAERAGVAARLRDSGAEILVDTCSYLGPILRPAAQPVMTDSAKWAYYAPGNIGASVIFGSRTECLRSAISGRLWRDPFLWGGA
jgi:predicted aconitase